jgi:peptidoglycan/LPS O-acetylase OafA/YrhL
MTYIKQLDSIRAIAVIMVVFSHWTLLGGNSIFPWGAIGVTVFFVLSGFLITNILLKKKQDIEEKSVQENKIAAIGKFMMRRALRIFPLYYLILILLFLGAKVLPNPIPQDWKYYALYVENYLFYFRQAYPGGKLSPMWSLAVEEQFYLIWPWLIFFVSAKNIKYVLGSGIMISILSMLILPLVLEKKEFIVFLTPSCFDAFCWGGILSYTVVYHKEMLEKFSSVFKVLGLIAISMYIGLQCFHVSFDFLARTLLSIFVTWILSIILLNKTGKFDALFSNKILMSIGKVSYGVYLFHCFVPVIINSIIHWLKKKQFSSPIFLNFFRWTESENSPVSYLIYSITLLVVVYTSFYFFEKPILKLKNRFE